MFQNYLISGYKLIGLQLLLLSIVSGIFIFIHDWRGFFSALSGGSAWIIPNLYFIHKLFKPKTNRDPQALAKSFLWGEGMKLLLSAGLIIIIMWLFEVKTTAFILGYVAAIGAIFLTPFWYKR
jgi:ATP synthase protein I